MAIDEAARHRLHTKLETLMGAEEAATLMSHLPPVGWGDVATRRDVEAFRVATRAETDQLRADVQALGTQLRTEMEAMGSELRTEMGALGTNLRTEIRATESQLRAEMERMSRRLIMWTSSSLLASAALAFAAGRLV